MKYWAFISYSHQDNRREHNAWADWLHEAIENFSVPAELVGKANRHGETLPERLFPSFQDEKELQTSADLGESIRDALRQSRYLVVICSPAAARSIYVNEEILEFKRLHREQRILAIIVDGEPSECFPPALRHPLGADGNLDLSRRAEPIAADARDAGGRQIAVNDKAHHAALEREKLRVLAGLLGVGFDDLVQRDRERQLREERACGQRLRKLVAAFALLALVATVAGVAAFLARQEAQKNLLEARQRLAQIYVERAEGAYAARDASKQALFLAEARVLDAAAVPVAVVEDLAQRTAGAIWSVLLKSAAHALAVAPHQRSVIVGTDDGRVVELETAAGKETRALDTRRGPVTAVAVSPDARQIATGSADGMVQLWDLGSGRLTAALSAHTRRITFLRFALDGRTLYSTSDDHTAIAWRLPEGRVKYRLTGHTGGVNYIAESAGRRLLATASDDGSTRLWQAQDGKHLKTLPGHQGNVARVNFTPDGAEVLTSGGDATIRVWETASGRNLRLLRGHGASVNALAPAADGRALFSASADQTIRVWDKESGEERHRLTGHAAWITEVQPLLQGEFAISCARDGRVVLWALPLDADAREWRGASKVVRRAAFAADGKSAATGGDEHVIRRWSVPGGALMDQWIGHDAPVTAVRYLDGDRALITASHDEKVKLWDIATRSERARPSSHTSLIWGAAVDAGGSWVLSGSADRNIRL